MTLTSKGYRHPVCVSCLVAVEMGIRSQVKKGRCYYHDVGDVCAYHFHMLHAAMNDNEGRILNE